MSLQQGKNIFEESSYLTQAEMQQYLSGELTREEQYVIEQKIASNQFNIEAMEGFEEVPGAAANIDKYKQDFFDNTSGMPSWLKAPVVIPALAILVGFLIATLVIVNYLQRRWEMFEETANQVVKVEPPIAVVQEQPYLSDFVDDQKEIVAANEIAEEKQISYEVTLGNQKEQKEMEKTAPAPEEPARETKEPFQGNIEAKDPAVVENKLPEPKVKRSLARSNVVLRYFNDLKTVDYSKFYSQEIAVPGFDIGGVDAKYEFKMENNAWERFGESTTKVPYTKYLGTAMRKFSENQFKDALQDYRVILEQFPDDQNALFYGGLCYYNLGKSDKAIRYFSQIEKSYINTFYEEAKWYKALSYEQMGDKENLAATLKEIVEEGGFYTERAAEKLK